MNETVGGFCRDLREELEQGIPLDPEAVAGLFVARFGVSVRPTLAELTDLAQRAGFGTVQDGRMEGLRGAHIGQPGGEYHIYHRDDLWEGSKAQTVAHEMYEIILEHVGIRKSGGPLDPVVCLQAERFAAAALMQPDLFSAYAHASGLDVLALRDQFGCSYASASLRMAEVVRVPPLMVVLYEHTERGDPAGWMEPPTLRAKVVRRTEGFRALRSWLTGGWRGGMPRKGRTIAPGSLAERAARSVRVEYAEADGIAGLAAPVVWKGRLAKVVLVAVPWEYRRALEPQLAKLGRPGWRPNARHNPRTVLAAP